MNVKVKNITNLEKFFGVIDQCEEKVELVTEMSSSNRGAGGFGSTGLDVNK